jgi:glycolate oxidase FAD binding subunit
MSLRHAQRRLAPEGLRVPATAVHPERDTLGFLFASGLRGWRSAPNRGLRESVLGLTAIDGAARVLKAGGRVVKNVAGYDMVRLHHGAAGCYGILTDLTIKLEALPESGVELGLPCPCKELEEVLAASRAPATALDPVAQLWCDPSASALVGLPGEGTLLLQAEGWSGPVGEWEGVLPRTPVAVSLEDILQRLDAAAAWRGHWQVGSRVAMGPGAEWSERWRERGFGLWMVVDLLAGGATIFAEDVREPLGEALGELLHLGGRLYGAPGRPLPESMEPIASAPDVRALKQAFDPASLLPPAPTHLEHLRCSP